jgi:hypothetical protein
MDIGASLGQLPRQYKQAVYLYEIKLPHDCRTTAKYKHNLGHSKGLKALT